MAQNTFTFTTQVEHKFDFGSPVPGELESAHPTLEITFRYTPGLPAYTPRGEYAPIDPPEPAEVELISAKVIDADHLTLDDKKVQEIAEEYLASDDGYRDAVAHAEATAVGPDPDAAYEAARDDALDKMERCHDHDDLGGDH